MAKTIKKRDGRTVDFDRTKILNAIKNAVMKEEGEVDPEAITAAVEAQCSDSLEFVW